ncbi:MAG: NHLP bacteriocin export ABC transporter permease/ATPase subunit [Lachnospiraceae bacterium]|nr:NHLP bacteriocin export ABC transporter permease/ATPase subunit [Lachnospiraceae bacterium]
MKEIRLDGGKFHITEDPEEIYRVVTGHVLVYIVPVVRPETSDGSRFGRRKLILEAVEGEELPSLCHESKTLGSWNFMFMALDHSVVEVTDEKRNEEKIFSFARRIDLRLSDARDFEEELIESYNLLSIKEEGFIYATKEEEKKTLKTSADLIARFFCRGKAGKESHAGTGHLLYDAAAYICGKEHIDIAGFDRVKETSGRNFTVRDIARVSHFSVREVVPGEKWYRKDSGPLLMFFGEDSIPVPCIPSGPGGYVYHDLKSGTGGKIDAAFADCLNPRGYIFYRPFPMKKMGKWDLFRFGMQKVYKSDIARLVFLSVLGILIGLLVPFLNQQVYDRFVPLADKSGLLAVGAVILSCMLGNISFTVVKNLASFRSMNSMEYAVQNAAIDRLFNLPESFFRQYDAASLAERTMDLSMIYEVIADGILNAAISAIFSFGYLFSMFRYSKEMSKISLILLGLITAFLLWLGIRQTKYEKEKICADIESKTTMFQFISGIEKIRISASENRAILKYLYSFTRSQEINTKKEKTTNLVGVVGDIAPTVFSVIFYYIMIRKSIPLTVGQFSGFTAAFGALSGALLALTQSFLAVNMVKPMYENALPILETLPESSEDAILPGNISGRLEVSHVSFAYDESEGQVLSDINLQIKAGEYVAIVGSSGCGKSTLLKLLLGFEKPQTGKIYYDNQDIDELDKRELRKEFGVVLQGGGMIAGSILENIVIAAPLTGIERVEQVIEEVGLKDDIDQMPMGLHTIVDEDGGTLSGGQLQRILIARALVGEPKIIFLDEATSALDNVTQNMVTDTLEKINATKIVIAHRLSTVKRCDRIIVMEKGRIVEEGSFDTLMARKGLFYELAERQM